MGNMKFSVILPTYNERKNLPRVIRRLISSCKDYEFEIIVVDDGSTDDTYKALKRLKKKNKLKLQILKQNRNGPAAARNLGAKKAKGEILAFTDADCFAPKEWLKDLVKAYKKFPEVVGVGGPLEPSKNNIFAKIEKFKNKYFHKMEKDIIIGKEEVPVGFTNNMSYKASIFKKFGGFDETFDKPAGEDFDLKQRICKAGYKVAYTPNPIMHMEPYDLNYFLRQILKRGTEKKLTKMSNAQMIIEIIKNFPEIVYTLIKKTVRYKKAYKR